MIYLIFHKIAIVYIFIVLNYFLVLSSFWPKKNHQFISHDINIYIYIYYYKGCIHNSFGISTIVMIILF